MNKLLKKNKQRKDKTPWTSTNETNVLMRGAAQIENTIKKSKNYTKFV